MSHFNMQNVGTYNELLTRGEINENHTAKETFSFRILHHIHVIEQDS